MGHEPEFRRAAVELGAQLVRRVDADDVVPEERDAVAEAVGFVEVVRAEEHRAALTAERKDELAHGLRGIRVEAGGRLVEEEDPGLVQRGAGDGHLLLHATRERRDRLGAPLPEPHEPQEALGLRARRRAVEAVQRRVEDQVVPRGLTFVQAGLLGEDPDRCADLRVVAPETEAADLGAPGRGRDERAQQTQGRGLAGPVRPEVAEHLALVHLEVDAVDRGERAEALRELVGAEDCAHAPSLGAVLAPTASDF
jgi:hypothetical protein